MDKIMENKPLCVADIAYCEHFKKGECLSSDGCIMHPGLIIGAIIRSANVKGQAVILVKSWNSDRLEWLNRFAASVRFGEFVGFRL